jgi:hypothetical protein
MRFTILLRLTSNTVMRSATADSLNMKVKLLMIKKIRSRNSDYMEDMPILLIFGSQFKLKNTVRQELKFFDADFHKVEEDFQLRTRIKSQLTYNLSPKNNQKLAISAEALFSISHLNDPTSEWSSFGYREMRIAAYYMFNIPTPLL